MKERIGFDLKESNDFDGRKTGSPSLRIDADVSHECGCEGSCPNCRIGEVENHKCDYCKTEYCPKCHGISKHGKVMPQINICECG